ncbi:hypothetical protein [Candidatus Binatus sp.]|uniref:Ig-like domain-containing protein n=1 Tax=Candidatus Binatus sp. TaxID=2811406 RepID=UPI0039C89272
MKNFGNVKVGKVKKQTFTLSNPAKSGPPIVFGNPPATVTNSPIFAFPAGGTTCGAQLLPKKKCKLRVVFTPAGTGPQPASAVTVFDNASNANQTIPLSGSGK